MYKTVRRKHDNVTGDDVQGVPFAWGQQAGRSSDRI